jgi:hypothetical protein
MAGRRMAKEYIELRSPIPMSLSIMSLKLLSITAKTMLMIILIRKKNQYSFLLERPLKLV